jgi:hypothetical protein
MFDIKQMFPQSLRNFSLCLSNILLFTFFAVNTVDEVGTVASEVCFTRKNLSCHCTGYMFTAVNVRASFAFGVIAGYFYS